MCDTCGCGDPSIVPVDVHDTILAANDRTAAHNREHFRARRVVAINLMGSPGAGKTALLELIRQSFCSHVKVLPESAGIVFGGGFPREGDPACRRAAQRAIFFVQRELEAIGDVHNPAIVLCDRGTVDGLAY